MKKFLIIIILFVFFISFISASDCVQQNYLIVAEFITLDSGDLTKFSKYQYSPYYKEDDKLILRKLKIENKGNCLGEKGFLRFDFITPENVTLYDRIILNVPELNQNEIYFLEYQNTTFKVHDVIGNYYYYYLDSNGKTFDLHKETLRDPGNWKVSIRFMNFHNISDVSSPKFLFLHDNGLDWGEFKVISQERANSLDQQETSIKLSKRAILVTSLIGIFTILFMWIIPFYTEREKQKSLLKSLLEELKK